VVLAPLVLIRLLGLLEREGLVNDGLDIVGLDRGDHVLELSPATDEDTSDGANVHESVDESGLVLGLEATNESGMVSVNNHRPKIEQ